MGGSATLVLCASLAFYYYVSLLGLVELVRAQNGTTPASEVSALNSVFSQWGISATNSVTEWNISGEPCSGGAVDSTSSEISNGDYNPGIKCRCDGTTCTIITLKVYAFSVVGGIPDELWSLTNLSNLNLAQNYLTGPLSSSIANLTQMQYMSLGINSLSGEVPKELGNLRNLIVLSFSSNNFSGPLPSELGKLTKLQQLPIQCNLYKAGVACRKWEHYTYKIIHLHSYFDSSGVSGPIPPTYAALQNLQTVWGSDNELTGSIPEFLGNWSQLSDLMISDLSNGSTSLEFLKDKTSLNTLILRNNNISGSIPSNIGDYPSLSLLDLSFNNLAGPIPDSLFNLSSLSYLFLGNNKLNGTLPALRSTSLLNIDVSYNELSGSFPSWIDGQGLQLNLVANNFTIESANNSVLPLGLSCLQSNFPCYRNSPIYSNFAIKCGGPQITSSNQNVYERDNETLGPATYYVTSTNRWAVSSVGRFINSNDPQYLSFSSHQFTTTLDSELFQTARNSPGSLRYYGLGLENGNYTVTLQFAEIVIPNPSTWQSLGRRVFDIYIQVCAELSKLDFKLLGMLYAFFRVCSDMMEAWRLHENDSKVELVDANLLEFDEEEVKRVIGVALLCTQTSPQLRPSMSRAVAMLSGDIEVSDVTTRPGYLTDWKFDDTTNFMTIDTPNVENEYNQFSSSSATTAADPGHSPIIAVHEVEEVIGEGR
ncbi:hypothetical protein RHGRI_018834 [Rhododendron griersonianum]|uniref:non-specific serine/threonine protein kinase n=1 Tax=Rhododendron griersonianum TaxID=479676 RepID=A0AAV6K309_9ERIC|nr:hypothetical protein RHGRI_018834 [Rhododendron griersonianum]